MEQETLRVRRREAFGSRPARRTRRGGEVPAIVYGRDLDAESIAVDQRELYNVLRTEAGLNALINVEIEGDDPVLSVAREIQRDPVRGTITHVDFIRVLLDEAIEADVSIDYLGSPVGVLVEGGFVETIATSVVIEALPTEIPTSIALDISALDIGDTLKVGDLPVLDGVSYVQDPEQPLVTVVLAAAALVEEEEEEELLEGAEELEDGEEPAEGDEAGGESEG